MDLDEAKPEGRLEIAPDAPSVPVGAVTALLQDMFREPRPAAASAWDAALRPGAVFGRFELVREIGRGGFGVVWEARDRELKRAVAFKALRVPEAPGRHPERAIEEAEAAARLAHPGIVTLHDVGRCEAGPYLVMELLRGQTLADRLGLGALPLREALRVGVEVARAAAHAHAHGVVHRDLAPRNVFLCEDGGVKVLDFGLARAFGRRRVGGGTPGYMAPEQRRGAPEDERTDVYTLGVILHQMLTGELPLAGEGRLRLPVSRPPPLDVPELPALGPLLARMTDKDPVKRPHDGTEVLAALESLHRELERAPGDSAGGGPIRRRRRWRALALAGVAGAGLAAGALSLQRWREERARAAAAPASAGPVVVAVADFANPTGDRELDALSGLVITSLEQSRHVAVLTRARMLDLARQAGRADAEGVDELLGREIARRAAARVLLVGAVHRIGATYAVELRALDPERDAYLFTLEERAAGKDGILAVLDRLSARARQALREPAREVEERQVKLGAVVTENLEAYQHFARGRELRARLRYPEAANEFKAAVAIDPGFALGHFELARLGIVGELTPAERAAHQAAALAAPERLPPKERARLVGWRARLEGRAADAEAAYRKLVAEFPDDKEVLADLGLTLIERDDPVSAVPYLERVLALDPGYLRAGALIGYALAVLDRPDRFLELARRSQELHPSPQAAALMAAALGQDGQPGPGAELALDAVRSGERAAWPIFFTLALRAGDFASVEREAAALSAGPDREGRVRAHLALAALHAHRGRSTAALAQIVASRQVAGAPAQAHWTGFRLALLCGLGDRGEIAREGEEARRLDPQTALEMAGAVAWAGLAGAAARLADVTPVRRGDLERHAAVQAWRSGRAADALPALQALAQRHAWTFIDSWLLAEASLDAGRPADAVAAARRFRRLVPSHMWSWTLGRNELALARALEATGERAEARRIVAALQEQWRDADPGYPPAAALRELATRLGR